MHERFAKSRSKREVSDVMDEIIKDNESKFLLQLTISRDHISSGESAVLVGCSYNDKRQV